MDRERQARKSGDVIVLGGVEYRIQKEEGRGGSSIVYRAAYRDGLNRDSLHQVLIKELFPYSRRGGIRRDAEGCLVTEEWEQERMREARESFIRGNLANLKLLQKDPEQISGNLNSYEAYGTCYSVLPVHGGENLEKLLSEGRYASLAAAADGIRKILDALECFHQEGILHLDISPDNILMLKRQVLLIDYNSTWAMGGEAGDSFLFSEKEGYSAPEIFLRNCGDIGPATDLYSVCAVFFRMIVGRKMTPEECMGRGLRRSFPKTLESFRDQPVTAVSKAVQILTRGLSVLPGKRYQSIGELRKEFEELTKRIEGKGISASALWESSRTAYLAGNRPEGAYLPRRISLDHEVLTEQECMERLNAGERILLTGTGGMGKTRYLYRLWGQGAARYQPKAPVVLYIPLEDYQQSGGAAGYLRRFILRKLKFSEETNSMEDALHELERLFEEAGRESPRLILLLDGLNEAGSQRQNLLREIEELAAREGIGVLVTDRTDRVKQYGLSDFATASLAPLEWETVRGELARHGLECPKEERLRQLLQNPMMLFLYRSASEMSRENGGQELWESPKTPEEMVAFYLENRKRLQKRKDSGNEAGQLAHTYLLEQLLPAIAGELKKRKKTILSMEELYALVSRDYRRMQSRNFGLAFPEYMGKSRLILSGIANDREWFDYGISEQLVGELNLMALTAEGNYGLIHDSFIGYLAEKERENQKRRKQYVRKNGWKRGLAALLAALLLTGAGAAVYRRSRPSEKVLSEEERNEWKRVTVSLNGNVGCWDGQIQAQYRMLEAAEKEEGDNLREAIEQEEQSVEQFYQVFYRAPFGEDPGGRSYNYLDLAVDFFPDLSKETLNRAYTEAEVQKKNLLLCMEYLKQVFCETDSPYFCEEQKEREQRLTAYREYLEAAREYYYLIYNEIYGAVDEETQEELRTQNRQTTSFPPETMQWSLGEKTEEVLEELMVKTVEGDNSHYRTAQLDMARYGFPVEEMEWPF